MHELLQRIRDEFNNDGLAEYLRRMRADEHRRLVRNRPPGAVVTANGNGPASHDYLLRPLRGTVVVFWATAGSSLISDLQEAYSTGDEKRLRQLSTDFEQQLHTRQVVPLEAAFDKLFAAPMYFDLLYGNKIVASRLALVDGIDYGAMGFAYNGGSLNDADFQLVEYYKPGEDATYETLVVKTPPDLSAIEREAVDAVPSNLSELNIGHSTICPVACIAIVAVVVAVVTCANGGCEALRARLDEITLPEDTLRRLGKVASARELLAMRREVFEEFGV